MRRQLVSVIVISVCSSLGTMAALHAADAFADGDPSTDTVPRLIPYSGRLEADGVPMTGSFTLEVSLYESEAGGDPLWTETHAVSPKDGEFEVLLGSTAAAQSDALAALATAGTDLWIGARVTYGGVESQLVGRRRFTMTAYSVWATGGSDFQIAGDVAIDSPLDNDGSTAPLVVRDEDGSQTLLFGASAIDSLDGALTFNAHSGKKTTVGGTLRLASTPTVVSGGGTVTCPSGTRVLSGGASCGGLISSSAPTDTGDGWTSNCTSYALCAAIE